MSPLSGHSRLLLLCLKLQLLATNKKDFLDLLLQFSFLLFPLFLEFIPATCFPLSALQTHHALPWQWPGRCLHNPRLPSQILASFCPQGCLPPLVPCTAAAAKSLQSCLTLCDSIDGSPQATPSLGFSRQEHWSGLPFSMHFIFSMTPSQLKLYPLFTGLLILCLF